MTSTDAKKEEVLAAIALSGWESKKILNFCFGRIARQIEELLAEGKIEPYRTGWKVVR